MAKKKKSGKKPPARRKRAAAKRAPSRRARVRPARKTARKKTPARKKTVRKSKRVSASGRPRGRVGSTFESPLEERGLGPEAGGQSGDTEGLSREELAASESVEELLEEGQAFEAGVVSGVENAPDADKGEVRTREVPEDDVPQEYLDED
jgi:hypothetical protein